MKFRFRGDSPPAAGARASVLDPALDGSTAVLRLYDPVDSWGGDWGVSAKEFARALDALPVDTSEIRLHINSPGGEVFEAVAIMNQLRGHKARVVAVVDGLAASAASFIAASADETIMGGNAQLMVHDAWGLAIGNAADMQAMADTLGKMSDNIAAVYAAKSGGTVEEWRNIMRAESWLTAEEAVTAGLADRVAGDQPADAAMAAFDLSVFNHPGRASAPDPTPVLARMSAGRPPAEPVATPQEGATDMSDALMKGLRERLGIPADSELDETTALAALDEALAEHAEHEGTAPAAGPGTVVLDAAQYRDLQAAAEEGREARRQQQAEARAALVDAAVQDGRIAPARREHWLNALAADPGSADTLAGLAKGLVPVASVGYTGGVDEASDEDTLYSKFYPTEKEA
ncbi:head maturation protease, ClpP-related [Sinomonas soli]